MPDAPQIEARLRKQTTWLIKITVICLFVLFFTTLGSLLYGFRILHEIEDIRLTSPERMDSAINILVDEVSCGRQADLETAVRSLVDELSEGDSNVVIEWGDACSEGTS